MKMIIKGMGVMAGVGLMMVAAGCRCPMGSMGACHDGSRYVQKLTLPQGGLVVVDMGAVNGSGNFNQVIPKY